MQYQPMLASDVETVAEIAAAYRSGAVTPTDMVARSYARLQALGDPAVFISLLDESEARKQAHVLEAAGDRNLPLFGIPLAVKDNIDVRGFATTAACPDFGYHPAVDAAAVGRLRQAGAIIIGKANLDQFATGLVGMRSPYGAPRNPLDRKLIPGGSSSGSAVAVATGIVPAALGTDTAGSGRVPALFNNLVGLKPSLGLISTAGVVPACRTLDCVSVFAHTTDDCWALLAVMAGFDRDDPYSRPWPLHSPGAPPMVRLGAPQDGQRIFFGDRRAAADYAQALDRLSGLGAVIVDIDIEPFYEAARLLYEGPWLAERYAATRDFISSSPQSMHPVTLQIILDGARPSAADAFAAFYRLERLRRLAQRQFEAVDALVLPTAPTLYTVEQVLADPIGLNSRLGFYTNFVNLLDLCGLAVPAALHRGPSGMAPFGITLLAPGGNDGLLAAIGRRFHADTALPLGALHRRPPALAAAPPSPLASAALPSAARAGGSTRGVGEDGKGDVGDAVLLAVAHAQPPGMPLNHQLRACGSWFVAATATAPDYRLYALPGTVPPQLGLLRVAAGEGIAITLELWAMPPDGFGGFVAAVPPPLTIGSIKLADGRWVKGFLVESQAVNRAQDISSFGR
jgi:allophanate hydrolase